MDAPQWLLIVGAVLACSAGVLFALAVDGWFAARLVASARRRAFRVPAAGSALGRIAQTLSYSMSQVTDRWSRYPASRLISSSALASLLLGGILGCIAAVGFSSLAIGAAIALTAVVGLAHVSRTRVDRDVETLRSQLPQLFSVLASSVGAGLSLAQAFTRAEQSCDEPMSLELRQVNSAITLGVPLPEALEHFAQRSRIPELRAAVVGLGIQHTAGGGLVRILDHASHQMRQGEALRRSVRSHTAQGRMTLRMVTIVPIGLAVLMAVLSDDYLSVFAGTPSGRALLGLAIGLEALGVFVVSRLLRVEV